jgi:hypothetical protein
MKRFVIGVVGLTLVAGIVIGGIAGNLFDGTASAAPRSQMREDVITIYTGLGLALHREPTLRTLRAWRVGLDGSHYPEGTTFKLEIAMHLIGMPPIASSHCALLATVAGGEPIPGSEVCLSTTGDQLLYGVSGPFELPAAPGVYAVKIRGSGLGYLDAARLHAVWTESR